MPAKLLLPALAWLPALPHGCLPGRIYNLLQQRNVKSKKRKRSWKSSVEVATETAKWLPRVDGHVCARRGQQAANMQHNKDNNSSSSSRMAMCALLCVCLWPRWMAKYLVGGQVSCSSSCQQKGRERERRGSKVERGSWQLSGGNLRHVTKLPMWKSISSIFAVSHWSKPEHFRY